MATLEKDVFPDKKDPAGTRVKLVKDAIGGVQLTTENGEILKNVFVKQFERIEGSVNRLNVEVIFLAQEDKIKNW